MVLWGAPGLGILFISHSSRDNAAAITIRDWLKEHGWGEVFLDLDPEQGLAPGHHWQQELKQAGERCSGVLVLLSHHWIASRWCQTEFLLADQLGKKIFPILVAPVPFDELPIELKAKFQIVDVSAPQIEAEGFERLAIGLKRAGLDPESFEWPPPGDPQRPIYRGLQSLDEEDAAIFFGRDTLITKGIDTLRRMRDDAPERMLVILAASGAGKSSFLKAGLIARLKRDHENFLVLPVIRPERTALSGERGLARSLSCESMALDIPDAVQTRFTALRTSAMTRLKRFSECPQEIRAAKPPTVVIAIDQAEELFNAENREAPRMLELLATAVAADGNAVILATVRSDSFERLQTEPRLAEVPVLPFSLAPIPLGAFKDLIECPARLINPPLAIDPALTDQLLKDLAADDALPLLAFTLERLLNRRRGQGTLTLAHYTQELGGLQGAIMAAVDAAFAAASRDPSLPGGRAELERLARAAFVPALVQIDSADAEPRRRVERLSALPEATQALVRHLVDERLLICDRRRIDGGVADTVEVAHEAILRQWPALKSWIAEERDALRALDGVRVAAAEWRKHGSLASAGQADSWLAHRGGRLEEAEALLARPDFAPMLGGNEQEYLAACRATENAERLRERLSIARTRRLQRVVGGLMAVAAAIVLLAGLGIARLVAGIAAESGNTLATQAAKEADAGNYDRSARYALASLAAADWAHKGNRDDQAEAELRSAGSLSSALAVLRGHENQVLSASFSSDGQRIVTASRDKTARIWDAHTARQIVVLRGHDSAVDSAAFSPDGKRVVTASEDRTARIWDVGTGRQTALLRGHEDQVFSAAFSVDGRRIVTASADKTARIWDAITGAQVALLRGHEDMVLSAAFSVDGRRIVTASADKTARIWDAITGAQLAVLRGHEGVVEGAVFSSDGRGVATASDDKTARMWDAVSSAQLAVLRGHENSVTSVAFSSDGTRLVTASADGTARIWDASTGLQTAILQGHENSLNTAAFSRDGLRIVTASDDGTARVWNANVHVTVLRGHEKPINGAAFSPDGTRVATASNDRTVRLWDTKTGRELLVLRGHDNLVEAVAFSPDGKRIISASDDRTARLWEASTGHLLATLSGHQGPVYGAAFSPDGKWIVTASTDGLSRIWNADAVRVVTILRGHAHAVNSAYFSPDSKQIVTSSSDATARIWDAATGRCLVVFSGHEGPVYGAMFSPDGTRIVTSGRDQTARIWDARTGRQVAVLRGHELAVLSAAFSPDGNRVITASHDRTARIWDANTGSQIAVLRGHQGWVDSAAFSGDGRRAVTSSDDNTTRIWYVAGIKDAPRTELIRRTCTTTLANGLSRFTASEIRAAPVLDPALDTDACRPPSVWARLGHILWAARSN